MKYHCQKPDTSKITVLNLICHSIIQKVVLLIINGVITDYLARKPDEDVPQMEETDLKFLIFAIWLKRLESNYALEMSLF